MALYFGYKACVLGDTRDTKSDYGYSVNTPVLAAGISEEYAHG